jgi:formylglycine-generating enzyme required for sulfatase activity
MRVVAPFLLDVHEMSVARYRDAVRRGFQSPDASPNANNGPLDVADACTWNYGATKDVPFAGLARESFPLNCISWNAARALCQFLGSDLPTEDQWEYAATAAGRDHKTAYPWGDDLPDCNRAVIGRKMTRVAADNECASRFGPTAVNDPSWASLDQSPLGVVGLAGNMEEWLLDGFLPYVHDAWQQAGLRAPLVPQQRAPLRATRGSDWAGFVRFAIGSARRNEAPLSTFDNVGLRCARAGM